MLPLLLSVGLLVGVRGTIRLVLLLCWLVVVRPCILKRVYWEIPRLSQGEGAQVMPSDLAVSLFLCILSSVASVWVLNLVSGDRDEKQQ